MSTAQSIVIVGSMAFDDLAFPRPVPSPHEPGVEGTAFTDVVGGSATYVSLAAVSGAADRADVRVVAIVGDDFPAATLDRLRARGVDTEGVERVAGKTFRWSGRYHEDMVGRDTLDTQLNVFADFNPQLPENYRNSDLVMLGNIHPALQLQVLDQVVTPKLVVADTMNFWIEGERELVGQLLPRIDVLVINDEEARLLVGEHNLARAARAILDLGPDRLIIKRGEYGSLYFDEEGVFSAPALLLDAVNDPTGAGDAFAGGLIGYLAQHAGEGRIDHRIMRHAMVRGTATASFCVEAVGPSGLYALADEQVDARIRQIHDLVRLDG
ncbi:MAG: PfkB family carbohydrate kinase [Myxococcota bacterium]